MPRMITTIRISTSVKPVLRVGASMTKPPVVVVSFGSPTPWHRRLPRGWLAVGADRPHRVSNLHSFGELGALVGAGAPDAARASAGVVVIDEPAVSRSG